MTTDPRAWAKCPSCDAFLYGKRLERNQKVCPECNHHFRLAPAERIALLLDADSYEDRTGSIESPDVLGFVDSRPYPERVAEARARTGRQEAATWGTGTVGGVPLTVAVLDFAFMGGSMGSAVGELVTRAAEHALETRSALLIVAASGGARMQEGTISLMQMAKTAQAVGRLHEEGLLCICLNTDPTFGGVTASFAMLGDVLIAEPRSLVGFAGPGVIKQTIRQTLPDGFQTGEFLVEHGMLDAVVPREALRTYVGRLLDMHRRRAGTLPKPDGAAPVTAADALVPRPPWEVVTVARDVRRPTTLDYIGMVFDDFCELHGDRAYADNPSVVGGVALLGEVPVVVVGHQKGHTTAEMVYRNFGMPEPEGYRKALRLYAHAEKFRMPVVTFVDTPGAYPGLGGEERGQAVAIARCIMAMARLRVPVVPVVTGEGGSGGALALAVGDRVLMLEQAYYSVISPEGCSVILWNDAAAAPRAAEALKLTAPDLLRLGVIDAVVPEPEGGAQEHPETVAANLHAAVIGSLDELLPVPPDELVASRYRRFRRFGASGEVG